MTKAELITKMAEVTGLSKKDSGAAVDAFTEAVTKELSDGGVVRLSGFGTFCVTDRAARECRNPQTGETMVVPAHVAPKFKPSKTLKEIVR